jgi:hypothetical protein
MGPNGALYVSYLDPEDGYVKVAVVKPDSLQEKTGQTEGPHK